MATRLVPAYPVLLTDYTQAEEDAFAATLTGKEFGWALLFNTTITPAPGIVRVWNGTAFESAPAIPPALLALATATTQGAIPAFGSALQIMRVNVGGSALEFVTLSTLLTAYQLVLVNQINIKSVNGLSLLGTGDLVVSGATDIKQTEIDFGSVPVKMKRFTITDGAVSPSNQIGAWISYDTPTGSDLNGAEWFENLKVMARAGTGEFYLYVNSPYKDTNGKIKINYLIG